MANLRWLMGWLGKTLPYADSHAQAPLIREGITHFSDISHNALPQRSLRALLVAVSAARPEPAMRKYNSNPAGGALTCPMVFKAHGGLASAICTLATVAALRRTLSKQNVTGRSEHAVE